MMFLQFFIWGGWYVTVGNYMKANGMEAGIPWAYSLCPIAAIISPFFLGMVADRFFATERVLAILSLLGGASLLALPTIAADEATRQYFLPVLFLHALFYTPTLGLTNTLAFHHVGEVRKLGGVVISIGAVAGAVVVAVLGQLVGQWLLTPLWFAIGIVAGGAIGYFAGNMVDRNPDNGGQQRVFPLIRVQGTMGWILANFLVSSVLEGDQKAVQFYVAGGAAVLLGLYSFALPHTPPPAKGKKTTVGDVLGLRALALLKSFPFAVFVASSFLICIPLAFYYSYAPVFVGELGVKNVAGNMLYGQVSEIFFMLVMPLFFAFLGVKWMLFVGMLAWVARYGLFTVAAGQPDLFWMVLVGIILHGICYDFFFVTGFIYVDTKASPEIRGQAQGFLVLITQGLGMWIGAQAAGMIVANYTVNEVKNWSGIWTVPFIAAGVIMVLFGLLFHEKTARAAKAAAEH
jgi:MFS family permease